MTLRIETTAYVPCCVVRPTGDIDAGSAPSLEMCLNGLVDDGHKRIVLDLGEVSFLDSTGIGTILRSLKSLAQSAGCLVIARPQDRVARVFAITGLGQVVDVYETVDLAILRAAAIPASWLAEQRSSARTEKFAHIITVLAEAQERLQSAVASRDLAQIEELELDFAAAALHCCEELQALGETEPEGLRSRAQRIVDRRTR